MEYCSQIKRHYEQQWLNTPRQCLWKQGPIDQLPIDFCVLEFPPSELRNMWTYATCCMSQPKDEKPVEVHLFSAVQEESHVELLTVIAHYNRTGQPLDLAHTINFGRPWLSGSDCSFGLLSLPYLDGPQLELLETPTLLRSIRFLWLIPITSAEANYAKQFGMDALEQRFEENEFDYLDPQRHSVA